MRRLLIVLAVALTPVGAPLSQTDQPIAELLKIRQYDLAAEGKALLEKEARAAKFISWASKTSINARTIQHLECSPRPRATQQPSSTCAP